MEVTEEEILSMEKSNFGNVRLAAYIGPPKGPTETRSHAKPYIDLRFGRDHQRINSYGMYMKIANKEIVSMQKMTLEI